MKFKPVAAALLNDVKTRIDNAQSSAVRAINAERVTLYWHIGLLLPFYTLFPIANAPRSQLNGAQYKHQYLSSKQWLTDERNTALEKLAGNDGGVA